MGSLKEGKDADIVVWSTNPLSINARVLRSFIDGEQEFFLIIDEENLEEAIQDLIRVGLDKPIGFATTEDLKNWDGELESIEAANFKGLKDIKDYYSTAVLDVRKATEYAEGNIPNAINIAHTRLASRLDDLPKDKTIVVHCASGQRASYAVSLLKSNGFDVVWVDDNFTNWNNS